MSYRAEQPFSLPLLPPTLDYSSLQGLLLHARTELAELKGSARALPNPMLLMSPAIMREAVASSEIENIHTTVAKALQMQLFPESQQREPDKEVLRYREAMLWGFHSLSSIPISTRLIKGIQQQLLPSSPGYRSTQNQIINSSTGEVLYTPPIAASIDKLMGNLENYIHSVEEAIDPLIRAAITHYQFEAIHPFGDGNGRTGRILMILQLIQDDILQHPILYISGFINKNRQLYYQRLREVSTNGAWMDYLQFMLQAFREQARATKETLFSVLNLYDQTKNKLKTALPKTYSADLIDALFSYPVITGTTLSGELQIHRRTAARYLETLKDHGFVTDQVVGRHHLYINQPLIKLFSADFPEDD